MNKQILLKKIDPKIQDKILEKCYFYYTNDKLEICDPYYTEPVLHPYEDNIDWEAELESYNNFYMEEIKQDELRYGYILEMIALKKELAENPLIFDKEEEYYETDPHKLVNFDEYFTPFFDKESNDTFFYNLKNPLRLKWEEIPEKDRKQKIVHIDQALRKIQYDEVEKYFNKYLINKDIVLLFLKFMPHIWPIYTFLGPFENYMKGKTGVEMYDFFIERILLLGSNYTEKTIVEPLTDEEKEVFRYMKEVKKIKTKMFKDLLACIKVKPVRLLYKVQETKEQILQKSDILSAEGALLEPDIFTRFIQHFNLYEPHNNIDVIHIYNYPEISKIIILLNLSFFNIFPIELKDYEKIRELNRIVYIYFLWYLKDFQWEGHESTLKVKKDIKSYFKEGEYDKYSKLIQYYPRRMIAAKEYFYSNHNQILREVAEAYLTDYFEKKSSHDKMIKRHNADFYILNQELQAFEKLKEKIYAKSRKLQRTDAEIEKIIEKAYQKHKRKQYLLSKILFRDAKRLELSKKIKNEKTIEKLLDKRDSLNFYSDDTLTHVVTRNYDDLINITKGLFIDTLKEMGLYAQLCTQFPIESKKFDNPTIDIYTKLLDKKLIEPNLWNKFDDYCYLAIDKYPDKPTHYSRFFKYQKDFIIEFMRDIMYLWGEGKTTPKEFKPILKSKKRLKKV